MALTDGAREIMLVTSGGKSIRFHEDEVRPMGREAAGVIGVRLGSGQRVISLLVLGEGLVLTASESGYGKLTPLEEFPSHGRGAQGVIALQTTERNGATVAALQVQAADELMLISSTGTLVRTPVADISIVGRNTQGVRLIRLGEGERLTGIERVAGLEAGDEPGDDVGRRPAAPRTPPSVMRPMSRAQVLRGATKSVQLATFRRKNDFAKLAAVGGRRVSMSRSSAALRPGGYEGIGGRERQRSAEEASSWPMLIRLSAMTPRPTQRWMPGRPL